MPWQLPSIWVVKQMLLFVACVAVATHAVHTPAVWCLAPTCAGCFSSEKPLDLRGVVIPPIIGGARGHLLHF